jgi:hypothetical protein
MKQLQLSLLLIVAIFASGCPKYKPDVNFNDTGSLVTRINNFITAQNNLYMSALGSHPEQAKLIRNELIERALPFLDGAYIDFITSLQAGRDRQNFVMDLVELGAAASVGITKGERPLQIIGVALTAFRGGRRSIDANFYKDQSVPILISKMDGNRAKVRKTILEREKGSVEDYSLGAAVGDLVDYYNAGTLVRAFTQLQQDTALTTRESEDEVLRLKGVPITGEISIELHDLLVLSAGVLTTLGNSLTNGTPAEISAATTRLKNIVATLEKDKDAAAALKNVGVSSSETDGVKLITALIDIRASATMVNDNALLNTINRAIVDVKK